MAHISYLLSLVITAAAALALIGVGGTVVRKAHAASGYLFIAAGALKLFTTCCFAGFGTFEVFSEFRSLGVILRLRQFAGVGSTILIGVLLAVAFVGLANKAQKQAQKQSADA